VKTEVKIKRGRRVADINAKGKLDLVLIVLELSVLGGV
jgi:hypothetical protein